jgi:serine/threonine protein kinase
MNEQDDLPARIDRYEPLKRLAIGGMAEIFLAKQSGLEGFEKVVVLKRILPHLASDAEFVSMFLDEARIAAKLSHPNVVQIYDLGKADQTYYIAMEYVSGRNVQHMINKQQLLGGHLPVEHVVKIIAGVCDGLYYAHARKDYDGKPLNIVHRDISPQNILVSFAGGVKVVDFGIAKASTQLAQTRAGVLKGKYAYMSPEQVRGAKVDHRSDIFAVGLVMYEMLTGMRAFERDNSLKTLKAIVQEKPLNPREMNPDIPMEVVKLLSKALEKNPDRRYKSAQEMQLALEDWLETSPKKSNNVRVSRFLYELFDDELNSTEGTLVVKGVGQVIIPTSQGKDNIKPAVEEEVDSKTLSAALVDDKIQPGPAVKPPAPPPPAPPQVSSRVRDEVGPKQRTQRTPPPAPVASAARTAPIDDDEDDNFGKTMPGYDLEQVERDHQAAQAAKAAAKRPAAPTTTPAATIDEDEDKTRAGLPMSTPSMAPTTPARRGNAEGFGGSQTLDGRSAAARTASLVDNSVDRSVEESVEASVDDAAPLPSPHRYDRTSDTPPQPLPRVSEFSAGFNAGPSPFNQPFVAEPEPAEHTQPGFDVGGGTDAYDDVAAPPPRRPTAYFAMVGASVGMAAMSVILFAAGAMAFPTPVPATEFGVLVVSTTPEGAEVSVDGTDGKAVIAPAQLAVPVDGLEHDVIVKLDGHKTETRRVQFRPGQAMQPLSITLQPK